MCHKSSWNPENSEILKKQMQSMQYMQPPKISQPTIILYM